MNNGKLFTIGHSNHDIETFISLLKSSKIDLVVDVRSSPYPSYSTHFSKEKLHMTLRQNGIDYQFMGEGLGGRPKGDKYYDSEGHVLYSVLAESDKFKEQLEKIKDLSSYKNLAIMCSEEDPEVCHRHLLIGRVLNKQGFEINYIRKDNSVQLYGDLKSGEKRGKQTTLFGNEGGVDEWKSIRSVLPKKQQKNFSSD